MRLPIVYSSEFKNHITGPEHPDQPIRVEAIIRFLDQGPIAPYIEKISPIEVPFEWLCEIHDPNYIMRLEEACLRGKSYICGMDNHISFDSFYVAKLAAGSVIKAIDLVEGGKEKIVFCPVRPPGHHAERALALGFCFFNNVAIGAKYWQKHYKKRVLILDWDAHHGNGIQEAFYRDPNVLYISLHENPKWSFPGSGFKEEIGEGEGRNYTLNIPFPLESGDLAYIEAFSSLVDPKVEEFIPEGIIIAAGFDAHRDDDMSFLNLTTGGFALMSEYVRKWQEKFDVPVISVLEGGYDLSSLVACVEVHLKVLLALD